MNYVQSLHPLPEDFCINKVSILKSLMYCGVLWGLFNDTGWAMTLDHEHHIFPFWLSVAHAQKHAQQYWPQYSPRPIKCHDFQKTLLPTLNRLNVIPALFTHGERKFKFNSQMMKYFFFNAPHKSDL